MKVRLQAGGINEEFEAPNADALLRLAKAEAAKRLPLLKRSVVKAMPDLTFAGEVVKKHNASKGASDPAPKTAQAFVDWAKERGYITVIEE